MATTKKQTNKKPINWKDANAQAKRRLKRVRHNLQEQHRWELFAAAALVKIADKEFPSDAAKEAADQADAMLKEWRKRWGRT